MTSPISRGTFDAVRPAHALVSGIAFLFFAIGGIGLRISKHKHVVGIHAYWQIFNTAMMIVGFALGAWLCQENRSWWKLAHEILGTIVVGLFFVPLILGYLQHTYYSTQQKRSWRGISHLWTARILILAGIIDGLIIGPNLYYAVIGGLTIIFYLVALCVLARKEKRRVHAERNVTIEMQ